ncbi:NAD(P)-binding domain-containing protein [Demequina sp.]|uniref:flavin-containing monooxygenase n=1 Tax=Demequina sp. TaxID=2050685 RepID=UPI0025F1E83F|nr:NAD(P)-binding domain-containing protein [Demequina sp.]
MTTDEYTPIVVIGGGQAGLATSYQLTMQGLDHVVLDANERPGGGWRHRWDSLKLFTPIRIDHLEGLPFPRRGPLPTAEEFADYLELYERTFELPVRHGTRVERLSAEGDGFTIRTSHGDVRADSVVVAMSSLQEPKVPALAAELAPGITSLHSSEYRNPGQLRPGGVLVVGVGNSGAEIAVETVRDHETWLAGRESGALPFRIDSWFGRNIGTRIVFHVFFHVLTMDTAIGRRARPVLLSQAAPLMRQRPADLRRAGVRRIPRIAGTRDGRPVAEDGTVPDITNVIWCTGYRTGLADWVDLPVLDDRDMPVQERGVVHDHPGLYFVGQNYLYAQASETVPGVSRDARYVADAIAARVKAAHARAAR